MSENGMVDTTASLLSPTDARARPLFDALDERPLTRRGAILLLLTAALFAWCWLAYSVASSFLMTGVHWPAPTGVHVDLPSIRVGRILSDLLLALAVGAMAAMAVRRFKWLVGPALIAAIVFAVAWASSGTASRAISFGSSETVPVQRQLHIGAMGALHLAGALVFGAIGGLLSARIFRRIHLRSAVSGMLAWVAVLLLAGALLKALMAVQDWPSLQRLLDTDFLFGRDLGSYAWDAADALPYVLVAACFVWATRRDFWTSALIVGGAAVFQILFGRARIISHNHLRDLLEEANWALRGVAAASAGAWLATALRREKPAAWALQGLVIVAIVCIMAVIAGLASTLPSGLHVSR